MDLGALDRGERLLNGSYKFLIWTEDNDTKFLEKFVSANGLLLEETFIFSYKASSKVDAAKLMAAFVSRLRPGVKTIIHRDRDLMSDGEIARLRSKYSLENTGFTRLFITRDSDMEAYFCVPEHLSAALEISLEDARVLIESAIQQYQNEFTFKFQSKRSEIKNDLYRKDPENCPTIERLLPGSVVPVEKAQGKLLLRKLGPLIQALRKNPGKIVAVSEALKDEHFISLLEENAQTIDSQVQDNKSSGGDLVQITSSRAQH